MFHVFSLSTLFEFVVCGDHKHCIANFSFGWFEIVIIHLFNSPLLVFVDLQAANVPVRRLTSYQRRQLAVPCGNILQIRVSVQICFGKLFDAEQAFFLDTFQQVTEIVS